MKIWFLTGAVFLLSLAAGTVAQANDPITPLEQYYEALDYSCQSDFDCTIKDIHNCCGYYPACLNKEAKNDPEQVQKICEALQLGSVCGFPSIESCRCVNNRCEGVPPEMNEVKE